MKVGVFTVIMGEYPIEGVVEELAGLGFDGVEWRIHPDFHIHPDQLEVCAEKVKRLSEQHGLEISSLGTYVKVDQIEQLESCCRSAIIMGCRNVRVALGQPYDPRRGFSEQFEDARADLDRARRTLEKHHVRGLLEIHHGTLAESASGMRRLLDGHPPETFGVIFDPGNMVIAGRESWPLAASVLQSYLAHVHVKNVSWRRTAERQWSWFNDRLDRGMVDWGEVCVALRDSSYEGYLSVEDLYGVRLDTTGFAGEKLVESSEERISTREKLAEDLAFLKRCMRASTGGDDG